MPNSFTMRDGYDRRVRANEAAYRYMTIDEAKLLRYGQHVLIQAADGNARVVKVNGSPKTWKRDANRVEVPCKYGLRECARLTSEASGRVGNGTAYLVVKLEAN